MEKEAEIKNSIQVLQASETRYRRLFETAQDGILILNAETGEIEDVNPYMIDMLHYSREEFLGMKLWEVSPFKDKVFNRAAFEELQDKGYIRYKDLPLETKEGKPVDVEFVSNVYKANGNKVIQCNIRNITERIEMNRKLQEAVIFQQRLIDALPMPVFYKDSEGRYLGCNSSFEKFFGQKREQVTGKSVYELFPKEIADIYYEKDLALLQNTGIEIYESTVKDTGGVAHNVIFHKATFPNRDGSVCGLIGAILDITDRKRAEEELLQTLESLRKAVGATIQVMVSAVEARDPYTAGHQIRSASLASAIANEMGLPSGKIEGIRIAGSIHDIGKLSIPAEILSKPSKLSEIEFSLVKEHARQGYEILKNVESPWPLAEIVYQHHERMDGSGYPRSLKGDEILTEACILAVADVVESMASHRPYRPALGIEAALEEIEKNKGILYDNAVADACRRLFREKGFQLAGA
jgi:PAS domain S-box-containing protein